MRLRPSPSIKSEQVETVQQAGAPAMITSSPVPLLPNSSSHSWAGQCKWEKSPAMNVLTTEQRNVLPSRSLTEPLRIGLDFSGASLNFGGVLHGSQRLVVVVISVKVRDGPNADLGVASSTSPGNSLPSNTIRTNKLGPWLMITVWYEWY